MKKVIISCDSTCDLPQEIILQKNIRINPLPIMKDETVVRDGIDITTPEMFEYTKKTGKILTTCAPNAAEMIDYFKSIYEEDAGIIHFTISSELSCTCANARIAATEFEDIHVIDTRSLSTGLSLFAYKACEMRDNGSTAQEIADEMNRLAGSADTSFVLNTLDYMCKGGRCSSIAKLGANLLKLKPCIEAVNGKLESGKKYRGAMAPVLMQYVEDRLINTEEIDTDRVFITHSYCEDELVSKVKEKVLSIVPFKEIIPTYAGCSISIHCGPGTLGILFFRKK